MPAPPQPLSYPDKTQMGGSMAEPSQRKRIWGWFFFDWASQPYNTLLITFIFAPYIKEIIGDGAKRAIGVGFYRGGRWHRHCHHGAHSGGGG